MGVLSKALSFIFLVMIITGCTATSTSVDEQASTEWADATSIVQLEDSSGGAASESAVLDKTHVEDINILGSENKSAEVVVGLNQSTAFEFQKTAQTEFVLKIPGALAMGETKLPKVAPRASGGIRSARAIQEGDDVIVRMFVDFGVDLIASPQGREIRINPASATEESIDEILAEGLPALDPGARAQLADGEEVAVAASGDNQARRNPTGIRSADGSTVYNGRLISLDLQDTDIDNALRIIAEVSNLNIIASDEVAGKVTLRLIDVPWDQALDVILKTNGLDQVTEGNVIRIAPIDKLRTERESLREAKRAAENLEDLSVDYVRISYATVDELIEHVESVLSERGSVTADARTNQLIIKDIRKGHEEAQKLIRKLDLRTPQVLLETQIVEANSSLLRDLGFQWNFSYIASPQSGNPTGFNFPNTVSFGGSTAGAISSASDAAVTSALDILGQGGGLVNFPAAISQEAGAAISAVFDSADGTRALSARLSALETEGRIKVISRPQVATVNNKQATIKSVETVRIRVPESGTSVATGTGSSAAGGGSAFEEIDVGIELTVTPQASPDYYVLLDVDAKSSTFGSRTVDGIPSTIERNATSSILVKNGQTFALGGVYRIEDKDTVDGVPFLKDIPFIGHAFRRSFVNKTDDELIFFITPHIVEGSFDASLMDSN